MKQNSSKHFTLIFLLSILSPLSFLLTHSLICTHNKITQRTRHGAARVQPLVYTILYTIIICNDSIAAAIMYVCACIPCILQEVIPVLKTHLQSDCTPQLLAQFQQMVTTLVLQMEKMRVRKLQYALPHS